MRYVGRLTLPGYGGMNTGAKAVFIAAVIAVLAAAAVTIPRLLPKSPEELYREDRVKLQKAVLVHITGYSPTRATHVSANSVQGVFYQVYPTWARSKAGSVEALKEDDAAGEEITTLLLPQSNPTGGKRQSWTPSWEDVDGDGMRTPVDEKLYYHNASPDPTVDHWNTTTVTVKGVDYVVDSRDSFINIDDLIDRDYLKGVPASASPDNSARGTGSYSWYVDENGKVKSMLYNQPGPQTDGFQAVYP